MTTPALYRQESELSKTDASIFTEKGAIAHNELLAVPETISEGDEDESGNVGLAAYEKSKNMEELVSRLRSSHLSQILMTHVDIHRLRRKPKLSCERSIGLSSPCS